MASSTTPMLKVELESADVSLLVTRVDIEDVDRGADKATFVMDDPGSINSDGLQEGMAVRIELGWETEHALAFVGHVRSVRSLAGGDSQHRVEATCMDLSSYFMLKPTIEGRQYVGTLREIIESITNRVGLTFGDVVLEAMPKFSADDPLNQYARTDWQMLQDLAEFYRARCFVEVNASETDDEEALASGGVPRLYFISEQALLDQAPMGTLVYCRGMGRLLDFDYKRVSSGSSPALTVATIDPDTGVTVTQETAPPPPATQTPPSATRSDQANDVLGPARAADHAAAKQNAADAPVQPADQRAQRIDAGVPSDLKQGEQRIRQDPTRILGYQGSGTAMGTVFLRAKGSVDIQGIASTAAGRWYVKRVNHIVQRATIGRETRLTYRTRLEATR